MSTSPFGSRRLRLLVLAALVVGPLLAACDTRPIVAFPGGGPPDGGSAGGGGGAALDGGDAG